MLHVSNAGRQREFTLRLLATEESKYKVLELITFRWQS